VCFAAPYIHYYFYAPRPLLNDYTARYRHLYNDDCPATYVFPYAENGEIAEEVPADVCVTTVIMRKKNLQKKKKKVFLFLFFFAVHRQTVCFPSCPDFCISRLTQMCKIIIIIIIIITGTR
jgi:hypothetical protein